METEMENTLTVSELIARLSKLDGNLHVGVAIKGELPVASATDTCVGDVLFPGYVLVVAER
jgi:hypothetical protein